ncbi:TPA: MucBP domain-containing protein, partial [Streptococcus suis]
MTQKKHNIRQASSEKVTRYAIKRLSVGVVSVAVAASFMVLNQNQVAAQTNDGVTTTETGDTNQTSNPDSAVESQDATQNLVGASPDQAINTNGAEAIDPTDTSSDPVTNADTTNADAEEVLEPSARLASEPTKIQPTDVKLSIPGVLAGADGQVRPYQSGDTVVSGTNLKYYLQFTLPDTPIKGGDFIDIALPEQLAVNPSPSTQEITDGNNVVVATYEMVNNRGADNSFINATGRLVFTDGFTNTTEKILDLTFNTFSSSKWADKEALELTAKVNDQPVSSDLTLINHVSTAVNFGTSNRLWQDDSRFKPYEMPHQSEVSVVNREKAMHTTLVYDIHPETQPYARYNVDKIRTEGYNIRFGESRANNTSVNTLKNDLGITATVNDAGTQVILDIPNTPPGFGLNGGSIPVSLTPEAIGAQYGNSLTQEQIAAGQKQNLYRASMKVYKTDLGVAPDLTVDPPIIVRTARPYNFITSSASSTALATVAVGHVNTKGAVIATPTSQNVKVGETFETQPLTDTSYTFKSIRVKHNGQTQEFSDRTTYTGTIEDANPVLVTYIYALVETSQEKTRDMGSVKVNYLDKD